MNLVRRRVLPSLLAFLLLFGSGGVVLAAPPLQQPPTAAGEMVYGLLGLLEPAEDEPANTLLYTSDAIHNVVGATPAIDERLRRLNSQTPPAKVKVWGQWVGTPGAARQLVVTGLVLLNAEAANRALAVSEAAPVNVRSRPDPNAPPVGQIGQGEGYRIVGQDAANQWWLICCIDGETAWVQQVLVAVEGLPGAVPVVTAAGVSPVTAPVTVPITGPAATPIAAPIVITGPGSPLIATPTVVAPSPALTITPVVAGVATTALWQATYFAGIDLAGQPVATVAVAEVNFDWNSAAPVPQLPADSFSARYEQTVPLAPGFYTLRAQADDGVRVYVNDELVIDEWHAAEAPAYRAGRQLNGPTTFRIEYYESGGEAALQFDYALVDNFPAWRAAYFDNIALAGAPAWVQPEPLDVDAALSEQWSLASPVPGVIPENNWSARWTGTFPFDGGNYIFRAEANDGVRVWIDDIRIIDEWQDGSNQAETVFENIGPGPHRITVEYYERGGLANVKVEWDKIVQP
jgi:uncharacterized protein YraI